MKKFNEAMDKIVPSDGLEDKIKRRVMCEDTQSFVPEECYNPQPALESASAGGTGGGSSKKPLRRAAIWIRVTAIVAATAMVLVMLLGIALGWFRGRGNNQGETRPPNRNFGTAAVYGVLAEHDLEKNDFISLIRADGEYCDETGEWLPGRDRPGFETEDGNASAPPGGDYGNDFAGTNNQVDGVDEGDIIKVDGNSIFTLSRSGLTVVCVVGEMRVSFREEFDSFFPDEMFIFDDLLVVIGGEFSSFRYDSFEFGRDPVPWWGFRTYTRVIIYNIEDRNNIARLQEYVITGNFITSRLVGNRLTLVINYVVNPWDENTFFPRINNTSFDARFIHLHETNDFSSHLILASLNLNALNMTVASHLGLRAGWSVQYFSQNNVYFFVSGWDWCNETEASSLHTYIQKISLSSLRLSASTVVDGHVNDRFWVSEHRNNLRVISQSFTSGLGNMGTTTNLFVLDNNLREIGAIRNFAVGQRIHAVRFRGDIGTIDTYIVIDIRIESVTRINLENPRQPTLSEGQPEYGVNEYLHFLSDEYVLGLGRNTVTQNGFTSFRGIRLSLYRNATDGLESVTSISLGTYHVFSEALFNHLAILADPARSMFSFPVTKQMQVPPGRIGLEGQGLAVFEYNLDAENDSDKLVYRGLLTNVRENHIYRDWHEYHYDFFSFIRRGARIGNRIFTISDRYITSYDVNTLQSLQQLQLEVDPCHFGHRWTAFSGRAATCTRAGYQTRACLTCGEVQRDVLPALGHSFGAWVITTLPNTNGTGGIERRSCHSCSHSETRALQNHVFVNQMLMRLDEGGYTILEYRGRENNVVIPAYHGGTPIVDIGWNAFADNSFIRSVTIGRNVTTIDWNAFGWSSNLRDVTFEAGSNLTSISSNAFSRTNISSVNLPAGVISIGSEAFSFTSITNITIPNSLTTISPSAFAHMPSLRSVSIPSSVTTISSDAFSFNPLLDTITVCEDNVNYRSVNNNMVIRNSANTDNKDTVVVGTRNSTIPSCVEAIGTSAFMGMGLTSITIPNNITHIHANAFSQNSRLTSVNILQGSNLRVIGNNAFSFTSALVNMSLENAAYLTEIGSRAFWLSRITNLTIPRSTIRVAPLAFDGWQANQTITVLGAGCTLSATVKLGENWRAGSNARIVYVP